MAQPRLTISKSSDYKTIHVSGAFGGLNPIEGTIIFYIDHHEVEVIDGQMRLKEIARELLIEIKLSPFEFKSLALWMMKHVKAYEERFGEIEMPKIQEKKPAETTYV